MFNEVKKQIDWNGEILELSTGKIARQADGAVMVKMGDTIVQCTTVSAKEPTLGINFFPLTVNYQEKTYASGRIPGGFFKREGRGSEKEILVSRLIDRPIRPLFHPNFFNETQILCTVHSYDPRYNPDILAIIGTSAALAISGVPFLEIIAAARVGMNDDGFILNPNAEQLKDSKLELVVAGTDSSVMTVESEAEFLTEKQMLDAVKFGHNAFRPVIRLINELKKEAGKQAWEVKDLYPQELKQEIKEFVENDIKNAFSIHAKLERNAAINDIAEAVKERFLENDKYSLLQVESALEEVKAQIFRLNILDKKIRIGGRTPSEIRQIEGEVGLFPSVHGSALFTRGETQAIVSTTLGTGQDEQVMESIEGEYKESFLLNYLFPLYAVGEAAPQRAPTRREIGHGKLAWRALKRALPSKAEFPYTIRVVSETSESNGSSSMATVCGGSMSLMQAGVPLKAAISGIAMGLIKEKDEFVILSDILGDEDALGDMDFKVAGSSEGITALQMDIKVAGITFDIMEKALDQAKEGRIHILGIMNKVINSNAKMSVNAPVIEAFMIPKDKIREVIGAGGKVIREICETTGAKIDINDDGQVSVSAVGKDKLEAAIAKVKEIAIGPEIGEVFKGTVVKILDAGAFVNYSGGRDGFVHISEIAHERIESVASVLKEGQQVTVKLIGFDRGKAKLTIKNSETTGLSSSSDAPKKAPKENSSPKNDNRKERNEKPTEYSEKRESAKKWKNKKTEPALPSTDEDIKERKYFN